MSATDALAPGAAAGPVARPGWRERRRERKRLRQQRRARDRLEGKLLRVVPPEGVPLVFRLAGIGARLGAQLIDLLVTFLGAIALVIALAYAGDISRSTFGALATLIFFLVRTPYYVVTEILFDGRTLAKRWLGLRVVSRDGRSLRVYQIVVRNLMREVEFFAPLIYVFAGANISEWITLIAATWIVVLVLVPFFSPLNQRLGDIVAGTAVIDEPKVALLTDMSRSAAGEAAERFPFTTRQLDAYGAYELQVLERLLRPGANETRESRARRQATMHDVTGRIATKIGYEERIEARDAEAFLQAFYRAQRAYLENRKLFGEARADKGYRDGQGGQGGGPGSRKGG